MSPRRAPLVLAAILVACAAIAGCSSGPETRAEDPPLDGSQQGQSTIPTRDRVEFADGTFDTSSFATAGEVVATVIYAGRQRLRDGRIGPMVTIFTSDETSPYIAPTNANPRYLRNARTGAAPISKIVKYLGPKEMSQLVGLLRDERFFELPLEDWTTRAYDGQPATGADGVRVRPLLPLDTPAIFFIRDGKIHGVVKKGLTDDVASLKRFAASARVLVRVSRWS